MKVILNSTVPKVGKAGTVVTVADGFARNYLFPRGLAIVADKRQIRALELRTARVAAKSAGQKTEAEAVREKLHGQTVRIEGQVGKGQGKLFGAVTSQDVVDAIQKQLGIAVEKKKIALVEPIKKLGTTDVEIDLHREVDAIVHVEVYDPAAPVAAPAVEAPAAEEVAA
ncbi:MAG TPA: 50S ribosomal protein L9 [Fimbriimonas sp.]|nr:50S ribosomal protein L9 [Fimbriimonas sp.]